MQKNYEWIPVTVRLPELTHLEIDNDGGSFFSSDEVLVCDSEGKIRVATYEVDDPDDKSRQYFVTDEDIMHDVIAWSPLPFPYISREKGKEGIMLLQAVLKERGISRYRLAKMSDINPSDLYSMLKGERKFFDGYKKRIADALDMSVNDLFGTKEV